MIPNHTFLYVAVRLFSLALSAIAPISILYYTYVYIYREFPPVAGYLPAYFDPDSSWFANLLHLWLGIELSFYIYFRISCNRLQKILDPVMPTYKERMDLLEHALKEIEDVRILTGWFMIGKRKPKFEEILRDNLAEWLAWAFLNSPLEDVIANTSYMQEINTMISKVENYHNVKFLDGYDPDIKCIRLSLDPVQAIHRPFIFYAFVFFLTSLATVTLRFWGFHKYGQEDQGQYLSSTLSMDFRHKLKLQDPSPDRIVYWHYDPSTRKVPVRPWKTHTTPKKTPIVLIPGISGGLWCYIVLIRHLLQHNRPIFILELPYVSMRLVEDVPTMMETTSEINDMLSSHGYTSGVFVGHSLGTAVCSWMVKTYPKRVAGLTMVDPICFLLHHPAVAYNFVHRSAKTVSEQLIDYLASKELYISHYISRHFHWFQTTLFPGLHTLPENIAVYLSEEDAIVDSRSVNKYLEKCKIEHVLMTGLDHAEFLANRNSWAEKITGKVGIMCNKIDKKLKRKST